MCNVRGISMLTKTRVQGLGCNTKIRYQKTGLPPIALHEKLRFFAATVWHPPRRKWSGIPKTHGLGFCFFPFRLRSRQALRVFRNCPSPLRLSGLMFAPQTSQRGLLPKGEASAKGVSPMSDWRWNCESRSQNILTCVNISVVVYPTVGAIPLSWIQMVS